MNMLSAYKLLSLPVSLLALPPFALSARGRSRVWERYGQWHNSAQRLEGQALYCFHAASMGEMNGLNPVLDKFRSKLPNAKLLTTSTSVTGLSRARADYTRLVPFDHPLWIGRALDRLDIRLFVFSETELWPALLEYLLKRNIPVALVNATISNFSIGAYLKFRNLFAPLIGQLKVVLAADELSKQRLLSLGSPAEIQVAGNSKYDLVPSVASKHAAQALKSQYFANNLPVVILGSVHPGEELPWLSALAKNPEIKSKLNIVLAPRHSEKFEYFAQKLSELGFVYTRRSEKMQAAGSNSGALILLDTLGELESTYSFADLAFIGGSLENLGGHNPLEAAAYGAALSMGPYVSRIAEVDQALQKAGAIFRINNQDQTRQLLEKLINNPDILAQAGQSAQNVWREFSGASERIVSKLIEFI